MTTRYEAVTPGRWSDRLTFSPAIRVGNLLFISGTTATDESLQIVVSVTSAPDASDLPQMGADPQGGGRQLR
jgi:enamine deaminase RidA (YjgF/YER057c/UK114 family)